LFSSVFAAWFSRGAEGSDRPPIDAPARPSSAAVQVEVSEAADGVVIRVNGEARAECAGALLDGLLAPAARRPAVVTLDLSRLRSVDCLAAGVLAAYRRGVVRSGGRVRVAGVVQPAVKEPLARTDLIDLFVASADAGPVPQEARRRAPEHSWPSGGWAGPTDQAVG
jgi:anti-anti-sigma factor